MKSIGKVEGLISVETLSRRNALKILAAGAVAASAPALFVGAANAVSSGGNKKVLIVYYSRTGNTRTMARQIQEATGGDIVELETVQPYPADYNATVEQAKKELNSNFKPSLKVTADNIEPYETIFIGSPSWWGTFAPAVRTFLSQHDFSGKNMVPFITHEGSGLGKSVNDLRLFCPTATILEGKAIRGNMAGNSRDEIGMWLKRIEIIR